MGGVSVDVCDLDWLYVIDQIGLVRGELDRRNEVRIWDEDSRRRCCVDV